MQYVIYQWNKKIWKKKLKKKSDYANVLQYSRVVNWIGLKFLHIIKQSTSLI